MTPQQPNEPPHPELAGLGARLAAKLIDLAPTATIAVVAFSFFDLATMQFFYVRVYTANEAYVRATPCLGVLLFEAALIAATAWKGKTPGKKLLRIQVVAGSGSDTPSMLRAIIRWALPLAAAVPLAVGFILDIPELANGEQAPVLSGRLWWVWVALGWWLLVQASALWDPRRRGWHDKAAGTIVIKAPRATM